MQLSTISQAATMSSREIAELVESRHDSVKRSMETLRDKCVISFTQAVETSHEGAGARPVEVYLVNKRDSYVVVAQLCPEFTARLVDRWQDLEASVAQPAPTFRLPATFSEALRLAAEQAEKIESQALQLQHQQPAGNTGQHRHRVRGVAGHHCRGAARLRPSRDVSSQLGDNGHLHGGKHSARLRSAQGVCVDGAQAWMNL